MAVLSLRWLVAVSAWLPAVAADLGREQPAPGAPVQTPPPNLKEAAAQHVPRVVTARPSPRALQKRDTNTCGYKVEGNSLSSYACAHSEAQCLYNSDASAVGCCLTTSCNIYTACLPYASSRATATADMDRTRYCSESRFPYCAALVYADPTGSLNGYTIPTCATAATTYKFYFNAADADLPTTSSAPRTTSPRTTNPPTTSSDSETSDSPSTTGSDATGTRATSGATSDPAPPVASSSTPVGPIVGGVVGGVAALGLIGLGIFFLVRRNKNQDPPSPPPNVAAVPAQGGFMPPPGPGPYPNQTPPPNMAAMPPAGGFDPRYSMVKPTGATTIDPMQGGGGISPASSPPPIYHPQMQSMAAVPGQPGVGMGIGMGGGGTPSPGPQFGTPSPPPPGHMGMGTPPPPNNGPYIPYPGPQVQQQHPGHGAVELPTQRGDGQVHELS